MLFDRTFRSELARGFGVTLIVLLTIVMTMALIRTFSQAAGGQIAPKDIVLLLGYLGIAWLPIVLALALFISVVSTLGRLYRDSEMAVWQACGLPLRRFVRPVFGVVWPVLAMVLVLVLWVWPWGNEKSAQLREQYAKRSDLSRVAPGQFQSSRDGSKVFFIDRDDGDVAVGRNVFILSQQDQREAVTTAAQGQVIWDGEDRLLALRNGQRAESDLKSGTHSLARFEDYRVVADRQVARQLDELPPKAMTSKALWRSPEKRHRGELIWRIGMAIGATNFALLGVGLAASNPRRPNNWSLLVALLVFVVYYNLIGLSQSWVANGKLLMGSALLAVHGPAFLLGLALVFWRDEAIRISSRLPWGRKAVP
jgi:lipopolysaccharide export system permease protein